MVAIYETGLLTKSQFLNWANKVTAVLQVYEPANQKQRMWGCNCISQTRHFWKLCLNTIFIQPRYTRWLPLEEGRGKLFPLLCACTLYLKTLPPKQQVFRWVSELSKCWEVIADTKPQWECVVFIKGNLHSQIKISGNLRIPSFNNYFQHTITPNNWIVLVALLWNFGLG